MTTHGECPSATSFLNVLRCALSGCVLTLLFPALAHAAVVVSANPITVIEQAALNQQGIDALAGRGHVPLAHIQLALSHFN